MKVLEKFIQGKNNSCEDKIFHGSRFIAVIDGCTSKNNITYDGLTGGQKSSELIYNVFSKHDLMDSDFTSILEDINITFKNTYNNYNIDYNLSENRMGAVFILYDDLFKKIYTIGDCQAILTNSDNIDTIIFNEKKIDDITSNARSLFNQSLIESGYETIESLLISDKGANFIKPLLLSQLNFENKDNEYGYAVINGLDIPKGLIKEVSIDSNVKVITFSSDGYPKLFKRLIDSENYLLETLKKDPLMIYQHKSMKGLKIGNNSFDDRAFISFTL